MLTRVFSGGLAIIGGELVAADIEVVDGTITAVRDRVAGMSPPDARSGREMEVVDCTGHMVAPGYIDLQCNGAVGHDITSRPGSIGSVSAALPQFGITSFLPTVVTSPVHRRRAAFEALSELRSGSDSTPTGADPIGLHFEGPMISRSHLGAHSASHVTTLEASEIDAWHESGMVRLVTLAPEVPGAIDVIRQLSDGGVVVSGGHTAMTPLDLARARSAGLRYATHLFNAMAPFNHRAPGPIGAVLGDDAIVAGLIADGIHVDPVAISMAWNALGPSRTSLVSDAVGALGLPYGRNRIAGFEIIHDETGVRTVGGVLAGSALALDQAVRNLITWTGCSLTDAVATVTTTPADLLGLTDRGRLHVGGRADFTILDADARLIRTVVAGKTLFVA